jgi:glyoxalase family protein
MSPRTAGIHHVTAIAGDPQRNLDFYEGILGLRLVKKTVNFDDPGTYHLYYGDEIGHPGTIMTFFPWPGAAKGRRGTGQLAATAFAIPEGAVGYWVERLIAHGVRFEGPLDRFADRVISFEDPDGLGLELMAHAGVEGLPYWEEGPVPAEHAIQGFYGATRWVSSPRGKRATVFATSPGMAGPAGWWTCCASPMGGAASLPWAPSITWLSGPWMTSSNGSGVKKWREPGST